MNIAWLARLTVAVLFVLLVVGFATTLIPGGIIGWPLIVAAGFGAYMAMNIGANDVANNVGPSVGSGALTMGGAIVLAGIFEASGALIAGADVVGTIKSGIIDPKLIPSREFAWLMMAALLAGALWLNIATTVGAPVSTTHSIVGGVLGAGLAAGGTQVADWHQVGLIVASWIISPLLGGVIAAGFLYLIKRTITYQKDVMAAARRVVPLLLTLMAWSFATYLILKGLKQIWKVDFLTAAGLGALPAAAVFAIVRPRIARASRALPNNKREVNGLFTLSLVSPPRSFPLPMGPTMWPMLWDPWPPSTPRSCTAVLPSRQTCPSGS